MEMSICKNNTKKKGNYICKRTFFRWMQMFMCQCACQPLGPIMKARMRGSLGTISQNIHQNCHYYCDLLL